MSWFSSRDAGRSGDPRNVRPSTPNWVVDRAERAQNAGKWVSALYVNDADKITGLLDTIGEALDHEAQNSHTATSQLEGSVEALGSDHRFPNGTRSRMRPGTHKWCNEMYERLSVKSSL